MLAQVLATHQQDSGAPPPPPPYNLPLRMAGVWMDDLHQSSTPLKKSLKKQYEDNDHGSSFPLRRRSIPSMYLNTESKDICLLSSSILKHGSKFKVQSLGKYDGITSLSNHIAK